MRPALFKPGNRINSFKPKTTEKAIETTTIFTTTTTKSTTILTTTPRRLGGGFKPRPPKGQTVGDLLSSIPRDDVSSLLPKGFNNKKPPRTFNRPSTSISSIKQDDVSKFLPPGFKFEESTTTTTTDTSLIDDILSSIEQDDLAKLLPKDFGPLPDFSKNKSRPKPPRLFQKTSEATSSTTTTTKALSTSTEKPTTTKSKNPSFLDSLKFDDVSAFLPPGKFHDLYFCYPSSVKYPFIGTIIS